MGIANQIVSRQSNQPAKTSVKQPVEPARQPLSAFNQPVDGAIARKPGPKPSGKAKKLLTLRLDQDVIEGYKSRGEGWQAQINADLRKALNL